ncbi:nucleolar protein 8 isoform X1 [Alligator mississippiensis]|uniref:nucleolar protein 8 isoform X1 n=2 Tax=Alligator mississippiensis TaxID=8496 RepID=UPI00287729F4|nr:nucleolar protein 8 isoform X1 [Alligator mississippiensis]XP_059572035.1 nucleolar protein 8 isoform X1 [Alligator mississippiensis]
MEGKKILKRLYVGGLGHTVSEGELQERFSKFGEVTDVEILTRKDEQGNPMKSFAYINISISESDLKKCMSILNKTKWKGGTLQIELAKESFLHRLAQEREAAKLKKEQPHADSKTNLMESLKKAGVVDFHMKAVPGTEVPDHKNWVVSKFGRVLPVLHLKSQHQKKIMKYDPSKYCHNLRKLEQDLTEMVPVSRLTWYLEEGGDSLTKKRQGDYHKTKKPSKKLRNEGNEDLNKASLQYSGCQLQLKKANLKMGKTSFSSLTELFQSPTLSDTKRKELFPHKSLVSGVVSHRSMPSISYDDLDSEEEIEALIRREKQMEKTKTNIVSENNHLEVVGHNFELKYNTHWSLSTPDVMRKVSKQSNRVRETTENDDYNSADTDEIIAVNKTLDQGNVKTKVLKESKQMKVEKDYIKDSLLSNENVESVNDPSVVSPDKRNRKNIKRTVPEKMAKSRPAALQDTVTDSKSKSSSNENLHSESEANESESDSFYENLMQNCYHLDLTLDDLKDLATISTEISEENTESKLSIGQCKSDIINNIIYEIAPSVKNKINPEDIVAAILEGEESPEEMKPMKNTSGLKYQPFRGIGSLCENEPFEELTKESLNFRARYAEKASKPYCSYGKESCSRQSSSCVSCPPLSRNVEKMQNIICNKSESVSGSLYAAGKSEKPICNPLPVGNNTYLSSWKEDQIVKREESEDGTIMRTDGSEEKSKDMDSNELVTEMCVKFDLNSSESLSEDPKTDTNTEFSACMAQECEDMKNLQDTKELCDPVNIWSELDKKEKQLQDNQKRLAALQERHKERELQKKLIQGAFSSLDNQSASKTKHIVFDSDGEGEAVVCKRSKEEVTLGNVLKNSPEAVRVKLFESSEDEQNEAEEDNNRFKIKPQFEGKSGEKLMHLQSRFGTDERFRMDAQFLETDSEEEGEAQKVNIDEEEELAAEKKKNLQILRSLLHVNLHSKPSKVATNAKKFKDINTLRYDPTRQDHAVFERALGTSEKESKAKRKKKREESEKLPEVSKEIYYDVAVDLKRMFGSTKPIAEKNEVTPWDKEDGVEESTVFDQQMLSNAEEESGGFTFSFFGVDMDKSAVKEEPYAVETIRPARFVWQEDPHFQDSSSEDETEASKNENDKEIAQSSSQKATNKFFFFSKDDDRLREGPKLFFRLSDLHENKDNWENRRRLLLQECRKKHKDARRKVKSKQ